MNFRPKKGKVIWSIIIPVLFWIFLRFFYADLTIRNSFLTNFFDMANFSNLFSSANIVLFVIEVVAIYLILSLFGRKNPPLPSTSSLKR